MIHTFFMKYKEPVAYGLIKAMQFNLGIFGHKYKHDKPQYNYDTENYHMCKGGIMVPYDVLLDNAPSVSEIPAIDQDYEPLVPKKKKKYIYGYEDKTADPNWPAAVKSNGGVRGSTATTHRRFR